MTIVGKMWITCRDALDPLRSWHRLRAGYMSITTRLHDILLRQLTKGRPPIGMPILLVAVLAATAWPGSARAAECFRYGETVTLSGHYFAHVAPPDDGVVRDARNDVARRAALLSLVTPYCVAGDDVSRGVSAALSVQLNCPAIQAADGMELSVTGRLLGAHTGNGHTPVLLMCL